MDEDIAIINQNTRVSLIKKFFKENLKKILSFIFIIIALLVIYFAYDEFEKSEGYFLLRKNLYKSFH